MLLGERAQKRSVTAADIEHRLVSTEVVGLQNLVRDECLRCRHQLRILGADLPVFLA